MRGWPDTCKARLCVWNGTLCSLHAYSKDLYTICNIVRHLISIHKVFVHIIHSITYPKSFLGLLQNSHFLSVIAFFQFVFEGMEESGSEGLEEMLQKRSKTPFLQVDLSILELKIEIYSLCMVNGLGFRIPSPLLS